MIRPKSEQETSLKQVYSPKQLFISLSNNIIDIRPGQIVTALRKSTDIPILSSDIYNYTTALKRERLAGLPSTHALIQELERKGIHHQVKLVDNRVESLFIACPESIKLAKENPDIILIDNTYKTNRFNMPLLHIVGECNIY